jgi:Lon protease-like protein
MAELLPLFPLPNVVLFPNVFLPLHIFEPRYREMVVDAVSSDRMIGMALLRPGWEHDYEGHPPVYPIGCSGVITHFDRLSDGRFNIVLRGLERFRIVEEDHSRNYRRASVEVLRDEPATHEDLPVISGYRSRLESLIHAEAERGNSLKHLHAAHGDEARAIDVKIPSAMSDEDLVNALAQYLDLEPLEKQALLEKHGLRVRAESLVELLEMKILMSRTPQASHVAH